MFIGRDSKMESKLCSSDSDSELAQLKSLYASNRAELFILYGRRRVGKTELLRAFCANKSHLFFIATFSSDHDQLAAFSQGVYRLLHADVPEGFSYPSWEAALSALGELPRRTVVVLDEFTYLIGGNKAISSILQKVWDERLKNSKILLDPVRILYWNDGNRSIGIQSAFVRPAHGQLFAISAGTPYRAIFLSQLFTGSAIRGMGGFGRNALLSVCVF